MKTSVKNTAKSIGLSTVKAIATPLHITGQLITNVCQVATDGVALGEGYLTSKIDKSQDAETVANARVEHTLAKFQETAMLLQMAKYKLNESIESSKQAINDSTAKIKAVVDNRSWLKAEPVAPEHVVVEGRWRVKQS